MEYRESIIPMSISDLLPWSIYDNFRGTYLDIPILCYNPFNKTARAAWHTYPESVHPHTKRYRLLKSICDGDLNEIKLVLDEGYDINCIFERKYGYTPLSLAAFLNRPEVIEYLILRGADFEKFDGSDSTPLMQAVSNFNFQSINILIEKGANIKKTNKLGINSIEKAKFKGYSTIAKFLEKKAIEMEEERLKNGKKRNDFPKFRLNFDFESKFIKNEIFQKLVIGKKYFSSNLIVYPFNDIKGTYFISLYNVSNYLDTKK